MKMNFVKAGILPVCCMAFTALALNHSALAQQGGKKQPAKRISPKDPSFRGAAVKNLEALKADLQRKPTSPGIAAGREVCETKAFRDALESRCWRGLSATAATKSQPLSVDQVEILETIFIKHDLKSVPGIFVTDDAIVGKISPKQIGVTYAQLEAETKTRLKKGH